MIVDQTILLIDDSEIDRESTLRALKKAGLRNEVRTCSGGEEALDYLFHREAYSDVETHPRPSLILLDLNMPGTNGEEVLASIRADAELAAIPVIVFTSSSNATDIQKCYELGASSFVQKPVDFPGLLEAVQRISDYWLGIVLLPKQPQ